MSIQRSILLKFINNYLSIFEYDDYGPNGLHIEGKEKINHISFAVSATQESILIAKKNGADALIVHHGLIWKFHSGKTITGPYYKRIAPLIKHDINLLSYHLPLDGHLEIGNAAMIAKALNMKDFKTIWRTQWCPNWSPRYF